MKVKFKNYRKKGVETTEINKSSEMSREGCKNATHADAHLVSADEKGTSDK